MPTSPTHQRSALKSKLVQIYPDLLVECRNLKWLFVPSEKGMSDNIGAIYEALCRHRGHNKFLTIGYKLSCDFVIPTLRIIIEYDERQHFTVPRSISLKCYPLSAGVGFDINKWISECQTIRASDKDPIYRDEQRAFYDSLRDLISLEYGYITIRFKHGDTDWITFDQDLNQLIDEATRARRKTKCIL